MTGHPPEPPLPPDLTLAVLGVGVMGGAVLSALLQESMVRPGRVRVSTLDPQAAQHWAQRGVTVTGNAAAARGADVVIVATKPVDVPEVLREAASRLARDTLVISLAAGVPLKVLEHHLPAGTAVIRVMPNTPALIGQGMSVMSPGAGCTPELLTLAQRLLSACGAVQTVPESQQDAVTALSGSGPAYVFYVLEAMIDAGVLLGLPRPVAAELAVQTVHGAAQMVRQPGAHPALLREQVTSPGGTTAAALRTLDAGGVRAAIMEAIEAAARRSADLT